jgi:hypothetical protein
MKAAHQIAGSLSRAWIGVQRLRAAGGGDDRFAVGYTATGFAWVSSQRFDTEEAAEAAAAVLEDFLRGGVRR